MLMLSMVLMLLRTSYSLRNQITGRGVVGSRFSRLHTPCVGRGPQKMEASGLSKSTSLDMTGYGRSKSTSSLDMAGYGRWSPGSLIVRKRQPDYLAALSYIGATATQFALILTFLHVLQLGVLKRVCVPSFLVSGLPDILMSYVPSPAAMQTFVVFMVMLFSSVRSRVFSPLDNSRPKASAKDRVFNRIGPWWQPPPLAFPIIWSSIAFLRAISTTIVFQTTGTMLCRPIFAIFLHLSTGDTWNTINNVEQRLGTAALVVPLVLGTAAYTTASYYMVSKTAARVLFPSVVWLSIANALVWSIYRLNNSGNRYSLFPSKEEGPPAEWRIPFSRGLNK